MNSWCLHEAYHHHERTFTVHGSCHGRKKRSSRKGVCRSTDAQARFGIKFSNEERLFEAFFNQVDPHIVDICQPEPRSQRAVHGRQSSRFTSGKSGFGHVSRPLVKQPFIQGWKLRMVFMLHFSLYMLSCARHLD